MDGMDGKQWTCGNGHVLGVIRREEVRQKEVRYYTPKLIIFRMAIDLSAETLNDVDVAGTIYGRGLLGFVWRCSVTGCGCAREWLPDEEALEWLRNRYAKKEGI